MTSPLASLVISSCRLSLKRPLLHALLQAHWLHSLVVPLGCMVFSTPPEQTSCSDEQRASGRETEWVGVLRSETYVT